MQSLQIIGFTKDYRTNTNVIYAQIDIRDYLTLVGKDFDRFGIQRRKEKHKGYGRLKNDIENGALIPTITLAIEPSEVSNFTGLLDKQDTEKIIPLLFQKSEKIYILDGLQRTYIINDLDSSNVNFKLEQKLLLEIWFEPNINHLIYRLIVLNAGQKPMSMRHQIELLFITMRITLTQEIPGLIVLEEKDETKRTKSKEFPFERLVTAYKSYLTKSPEVDKDNIVAERMIESDLLDSNEEYLSDSFIKFKRILAEYCRIDEEVFRIYNNSELNKYKNWLSDGNVINSFFAAVKSFTSNDQREKVFKLSIEKFYDQLKRRNNGEDALFLNDFYSILSNEFVAKKYNVGFATRKLLTSAFVEFFRYEGEQSLKECWIISSSDL